LLEFKVASRQYVRLNELHDAVGSGLPRAAQVPAAMCDAPVARLALSLATAACVAGDDAERNPPHS